MKQYKISGIQRKYLKYMLSLLMLALLLSSIGVWTYVKRNMTGVIVDKYESMNEKMGISLDNLYKKSDGVLAECIVDDNVQKSLKNKGLQEMEKNALSKYFAYIDFSHVSEYCYVDNKENLYTKSYSQITYDDFKKSGLKQKLGSDYARTKWIWTKDTLFGTKQNALFIGRYVHSMDYAHEPGTLFLKMDTRFLEDLTAKDRKTMKDVAVGIMDGNGQMCLEKYPKEFELEKEA